MLRNIVSVGGLTLLSRVVGFGRDLLLAAILGGGPVADAFLVAFRLPNHFRAIFGEGALNAAFVPTFAQMKADGGLENANRFADSIFTLMFLVQLALLAAATVFMPLLVRLLAPGLDADPLRYPLAVELTRITFPYLLLITLVTQLSATLNAIGRFAAAAAAPILLNLSMILALIGASAFPTPGHAAAFGVVASGLLQFLFVSGDALRSGVMPMFARPRLDAGARRFFKALVPATIGGASVQIALFADTILSSFLPTGAIAALYYADRINQLPVGIIGIATGTVLLSEMSRRLAKGDEVGAKHAQNRAIEITLIVAVPCVVAFLVVPDAIMRGLFVRGAFTGEDAARAAGALAAYGAGLLAFVQLRSFVSGFQSRGDTTTPMIAALISVAFNVGFKIALTGPLEHVGLAVATSIGAWVNVLILVGLGLRRGFFKPDRQLMMTLAKLAGLAALLTIALVAADAALAQANVAAMPRLAGLVLMAAFIYGGGVLLLFGRAILKMFRARA